MRVRALFLAGLVAAAACSGKDPYKPGTALGNYHVQATHTANTCGDQNVPPNPWKFDVKLSTDPGKLYWVQGGLPVQGTLDAHANALMTSSSSSTIHPANPKTGLGACSLTRKDTLTAALVETTVATADGGTEMTVPSFTGTLHYSFAPDDGSDCADLVDTGGFANLPCEIGFSLSGTRAQ
jgi:hypothetical protein